MHLKQDPCLYFGEKYPFCAVTRARAKLDTVRARFNDGNSLLLHVVVRAITCIK